MSTPLRRLRAAFLLALLFMLSPAVQLVAQATDSLPPVPAPDPHTTFMLGLAGLVAVIAREVGSLLVGVWNKAGGWLDGKSNELKRVVTLMVTGALGLLTNALASVLTHSTNWMVSLGLSVGLGIVSVFSAGVTINAVKSKLTTAERSSIAHR